MADIQHNTFGSDPFGFFNVVKEYAWFKPFTKLYGKVCWSICALTNVSGHSLLLGSIEPLLDTSFLYIETKQAKIIMPYPSRHSIRNAW